MSAASGREQRRAAGARIAAFRERRRLTQRELAQHAHVSLSLVSKVEAGQRAASAAFLAAVAPALRVSAAELAGTVLHVPERRDETAIDSLHAVLTRLDIPLAGARPPRPLDELRVATGEVSRLRLAGRYTRLGARLPGVLSELAVAAHQGRAGVEAWRLLVGALFAAHALAYKTGHPHLATLAEDRMAWAAAQTRDPLLRAVAAWARCTSLLGPGGTLDPLAPAAGLALLEAARDELEASLRERPSTPLLSVYGGLHLRAAVLASRTQDAAAAWRHIAAAWEMVERGAADHNPTSILTCGPANAGVVAVAVAVELGDAADAIERAAALRIPAGYSPVRAGQHYVDLARALVWEGRRAQALRALLTAERHAPQQTRHHPMAHEVLGTLAHLERRRPDSLLALAARVRHTGGVDVLA